MAVRRRTRAPPAPLRWEETASIVDKYWGEMTSEAIRQRVLESAPRNPLHTHRIIRKLYIAFFFLYGFFVLVPLWFMWYWPRFTRPRRSWTAQRCVRVRWSRRICAVVARCEIDWLGRDLSVQLDPSRLIHSHPVTIGVPPDSWLIGYAAKMMNQLHATRGKWHPDMVHRRSPAWSRWNPAPSPHGFAPVSAFWYSGPKASRKSKVAPRQRGDPVLLAFHGGGYVCGTAAETDATSLIYRNLVQYTPIKHVLSVDYRLANKAPWPLPLLDAIAAYYHLVAVEGIDERDILFGGDSAGGHLALATMRWVRDAGPQLGLRGPRAMLLFSPWSDTGFTHVWGDKLMKHNLGTDIIHDSFGPFAAGLLTRAMPPGCIHDDVYLSPASRLIAPDENMFADFPPMFITYGEVERISLEITDLFRRVQLARRSQPTVVPDELYQAPDGVHDFMIFPWFAEETAAVLERLDEWLRDLLSRDDTDDDVVVSTSLGPHADLPPLGMISPATELPPPLAPLTGISGGRSGTQSSRPSPHPSPFSPFAALSPMTAPQSPYFHALSPEEKQRRQEHRAALKTAKSPRMVPVRDTPRFMYADMRHEGLHYLDIPHLDLGGGGGSGVPIGSAALEEDELRLDAEDKDAQVSSDTSSSDDTSRPSSSRGQSASPPRSKM
ncbi:hypothetical protein CspHIS471_0409230 [Cutaneotrichosporon sp. HIS471]|nr:hypothetical protein CspHIS471_0409230 [Cutaneotrichosporon sp. HIS471]